MKIMVFTEGTILMHNSARGLSRKKIVVQSKKGIKSVYDYEHHIPVGNAVKKLEMWKEQGVKIMYLTSRKSRTEVEIIKKVLKKNGFPDGKLFFRKKNEGYTDVAERVMPDILIEDDCESIGEDEITYTRIKPELKKKIKSIIVKEFGGIDHLPDEISDLETYKSKSDK